MISTLTTNYNYYKNLTTNILNKTEANKTEAIEKAEYIDAVVYTGDLVKVPLNFSTTYESSEDFITSSFEERDMEMIEIFTGSFEPKQIPKGVSDKAESIDALVHDRFPFIKEFGGREAFEKLMLAPPKSIRIELKNRAGTRFSYKDYPVQLLEEANHISIHMDLIGTDGSFEDHQTWNFTYYPQPDYPSFAHPAYLGCHLSFAEKGIYNPLWTWLGSKHESVGSSGISDSEPFGRYLKGLVDGEATPEHWPYENRKLKA